MITAERARRFQRLPGADEILEAVGLQILEVERVDLPGRPAAAAGFGACAFLATDEAYDNRFEPPPRTGCPELVLRGDRVSRVLRCVRALTFVVPSCGMPKNETVSQHVRRPQLTKPASSQSLQRGLALLEHIADSGEPLGLGALSRGVGIHKATAHRLVAALEKRGYVSRQGEPPVFGLGTKAFALARGFVDQLHMYDRALDLLRGLRDASSETAAFAVRSGVTRVFVPQIQSPLPVRHAVDIGVPRPLVAGATGKAILAFLPEADVSEILVERGPKGPPSLRQELARIRAQGFALTEEEVIPGTAAVAAPILGLDGVAVGAVSLTGPYPRFTAARRRAVASMVMEAAQALSRYHLIDRKLAPK